MSNPYKLLGFSLCLAGALLAPVFYFIVGSAPLTAVSLSAVMLGFTAFALANARPYVSPEACQMLLETGMENTAALLEELGLRNKAIYLPSHSPGEAPQAVIPLVENGETPDFKDRLPGRLIVRYGNNPNAMGIAVTTPGSVCIKMLEAKPGPTSIEIEAALTYVLVGVLDTVESLKLSMVDSKISIELVGATLKEQNIWYYYCVGSPVASIAAAITSEALGKPIVIKQEIITKSGKLNVVELEVMA